MNLFDMSPEEYKLFHKVEKLRNKIKLRTKELNITTDHTLDGHFYVMNGKRYPSVTGRLQILKDPGLMNWKMNRALEYILAEATNPKHDPNMTWAQLIERAKLAPQLEFEGAGSIGSAVHAWRDAVFREIINGKDWEYGFSVSPIDDRIEVISGCRAIRRFFNETHYQPIACEFYLADDKLNTGGTGDDFGILNSKQTFLDLKTSNIGDKDSYFYQVALYIHMFEKLYHIRVQDAQILHVSKTDGTYKLIPIPDFRKRIKEAKQIIKVDEFLRSLRKEKKKVPIII